MTYKTRKHIIFLMLTALIPFTFGCNTAIESSDRGECFNEPYVQQAIDLYVAAGKTPARIDFNGQLDPCKTQTDFQILRQILEEANPNIYRYAGKEKMDRLFDSTLHKLGKPLPYLEFVMHVSRIFNAMACGHSSWMHSSDYRAFRDTAMEFFPVKIFAEEDRYIVKYNLSADTAVKAGDEILSVNGTPPKELNSILQSYMYRDGQSAPGARTEIADYFDNAYSNFIGNPDTFYLVLKNAKGEKYKTALPAQNKSKIDSFFRARYKKSEGMGVPLRLKVDSATNSALYTIKWFRNEYIEQYDQDFDVFTDSAFQVLESKKIKTLIIDLRGNVGGWTANGKKLFSYFIDEPTDYIQSVEFTKIDTFSFQPLIIYDRGINDSMFFKSKESGQFEWINYPSLKAIPAKENRFKGNIYILTDDMSRSCSAIFSSLMRAHTKAKFVGEETGGAQCGSGGILMSVILPYTGITVTTSTAKYTCNTPNEARGIQVDYPVKTTWEAHTNGRDPQLEFIYKLIK